MVDVRCAQDAEPRSFVNFINKNLEATTMSEEPRPERALVKVLMPNGEQPFSVYLKRPVSQLLDFKELSDAEGFLRNKVALNLRATFEEQTTAQPVRPWCRSVISGAQPRRRRTRRMRRT
jgi:hypothetical protein